VVHVQTRGVRRARRGGRAELEAQAGEPWDDLVAVTVADGLAGIECLSGIPGSTGATPIQNVGAYGQEVATTVAGVRVYDRASGRVEELTPEQCGFGYRTSALKRSDRRVVLSVRFVLEPGGDSHPVRYAELARALGVGLGERVPLAAARDAVIGLRRGKGMVVDPADADSVSAGSFFTNPILDRPAFRELERRAEQRLGDGVRPPAYEEGDGRVKTSAAWLIERAGFAKGLDRGPVGISTKHSLALVNRGGATTRDLVGLAREIAAAVLDAFGIALTPEPVFVGHAW
jgi:UDP-N-acetylmuramate dehydrogenase